MGDEGKSGRVNNSCPSKFKKLHVSNLGYQNIDLLFAIQEGKKWYSLVGSQNFFVFKNVGYMYKKGTGRQGQDMANI